MVVQVGADGAPDRHVKRSAVIGEEVLTFVLLEDVGRALLRRAMPTLTSDHAAPVLRLRAYIGKIDERATLPETPLDIRNEAFNVRFIARMTHASRVDQKPARLAVFEEATRRPWLQRIRSGDRRREIIQLVCPTRLCGRGYRSLLGIQCGRADPAT